MAFLCISICVCVVCSLDPRSGNVSRDSEVFKCRKYIADVDGHPRIYIRVIEMSEGTDYMIEQGYPIGDNDNDDDDAEGHDVRRAW